MATPSRTVRTGSSRDQNLTEDPVSLLICCEQQLFGEGLQAALERFAVGTVVVTSVIHDLQSIDEAILRHAPDVVVVGGVAGKRVRATVERVTTRFEDVRVLVFHRSPDGTEADDLIAAGAHGLLPGTMSPRQTIGPILALAAGCTVLPTDMARHVLRRGTPPDDLRSRLDDGEIRLWLLVAAGYPDAEIARMHFVSVRTVKRRVAALLRKLGVSRRIAAATLAGHYGMLPDGEATENPCDDESVPGARAS